MGNPHCVVFVEDLDLFPFEELGPAVERAPKFPARVNAEFVQVLGREAVRMRVWERGVGETMACGSGACAVAVASAVRDYTGRDVSVHMPGGAVEVEWAPDNRVSMTGPAEEVFRGTLDPRFERALLAGVTT
jgi:diaminopimelate epimerase